jgi:hypothetical protein
MDSRVTNPVLSDQLCDRYRNSKKPMALSTVRNQRDCPSVLDQPTYTDLWPPAHGELAASAVRKTSKRSPKYLELQYLSQNMIFLF